MKMLRLIAAVVAFLSAAPAIAQWQTPNHSVPAGRGGGIVGFGNSLPGTVGSVLTSNGPTQDPTFQAPLPSGVVTQGRLTLISGDPWMTSGDAIGARTLYLAPVDGNGSLPSAPIYNGIQVASYPIAASLTDQVGNLSLPLGGSAAWPAGEIDDVFLALCSGSPCLGTRAWDSSMLPSTPALITPSASSGSPGYVTSGTTPVAWTTPANAFNGTVNQAGANSAIVIPGTTSGAACLGQDWGAGITNAVSQITITAPTDNPLRGDSPTYLPINSFVSDDGTNWTLIDQRNINASANNTQYVLGINARYILPHRFVKTCITPDAVHAIRIGQLQFSTTAGPITRRLARYGGMLVNDDVITLRTSATTTIAVPQYQAKLLGTVRMDAGAAGQVSAYNTAGPGRVYNLWNADQQRIITLQAVVPFTVTGVGPNNYALTNTGYAFVQGTNTFSISVLIGYSKEPVSVSMVRCAYMNTTSNGAGYVAGIGLDSGNNISGTEFSMTTDSTGQTQGFQGTASLTMPPFFGQHTFYGVEALAYTPSGGLNVFTNMLNTNITASWRG